MCKEVTGIWVGLTACLHSNLEAGFKKTKQEKTPPPRSQPAHGNRPWLFPSNKASRVRGWQAGQEGSRSGPQSASPATGNGIPWLLPDFWVMLDRGPSVPTQRSRSPSLFPFSYWPTPWLVAVPFLGVLVTLSSSLPSTSLCRENGGCL